MATYTPSTIDSFMQPGRKRVELTYRQGVPIPDLTGKSVHLVGRIFSVVAQSQDPVTGYNCLVLSVAVDPAAAGVNQVLDNLPAGTLVNVNGQWAFTNMGPTGPAVPIVSVGMVAAGVVSALASITFIYVNVQKVEEVTQPGAGLLTSLVGDTHEALAVVLVVGLVAFIAWKAL